MIIVTLRHVISVVEFLYYWFHKIRPTNLNTPRTYTIKKSEVPNEEGVWAIGPHVVIFCNLSIKVNYWKKKKKKENYIYKKKG